MVVVTLQKSRIHNFDTFHVFFVEMACYSTMRRDEPTQNTQTKRMVEASLKRMLMERKMNWGTQEDDIPSLSLALILYRG